MAKGHDTNQPAGEQHSQSQAAHGVAPAAAAANPPAPAYDPMLAKHEAAHVVIIDDFGYKVTWVNIAAGPGLVQQTKADWGEFGEALKTINWENAAERDAIGPRVLEYVTMLVAGHLAENLIDGDVERVSTRIQANPGLLAHPPSMKNAVADRDRTALFLYLVQRNTLAEVIAAEERALKILQRRTAHHKALAELLVQEGTVEGAPLDKALGKALAGGGGQGEPAA
jgi:hypothetical protein